MKKAKVNKKWQAISQLLTKKNSLSVSIECVPEYKDGKQFKLLHSLEHFVCTV